MTRGRLLALVMAVVLAAGAIAIVVVLTRDDGAGSGEAAAPSATGGFLADPPSELEEPGEPGEEGEDVAGMLTARYQQRSFPQESIGLAQTLGARSAFAALPLRVPAAQGLNATSSLALSSTWQSVGPTVARALPNEWGRYETLASVVSGRVTTLLVGPRCVPGDCRLWLGAAGGGVFRTDDALAPEPVWQSKSVGLTSGAIGTLTRDPSDATGQTVYAGTGEGNGSVDSEAGEGVFKSTNGGDSWSILAGSSAVAAKNAVTGVVVDPRRPQTIYISTAASLHGTSSVVGGEAPPPGAPEYGVYVSTDGGASFDFLDPDQSPTRRSVTGIALDPNVPDTLYAAVMGEGLFRRSERLDGDLTFRRVFEYSAVEAGDASTVEFALADLGERTRIYVGSSDPSENDNRGVASLYRTDDAGRPAADLRAGWTLLSSDQRGTAGFSSYRYCGEQCWYGNYVASPPGQPDVVWLGGNFAYDEAARGVTAGRAVLRSSDAGASFNDMSSDARDPRFEMHPDQHAIAFSPSDPNVVFAGSDGGVVRLSGGYVSKAERCAGQVEPDLAWCRQLLSRVPARIDSLNSGLDTLQLQSVSLSVNPQVRDLLIGTQDNGTWSFSPERGWSNVAGGDGGQSGIDSQDARVRFHSWFGQAVRINHSSGDPRSWRGIYSPLYASGEDVSFYAPIIADPRVGGTMFIGMEHVWRTQQSGGPSEQIVTSCDDSDGGIPSFCGDWVPLGNELTGVEYGNDRTGYYVAAVERAPSDTATLWAATLHGRVFVSKNAGAPAASVTFARIDVPTGTAGTAGTPGRFVSGIAVDPANPNHAWISYSGYDAYTPDDQQGHVFEVVFDPGTGSANWTNRSYKLEDLPVTDIARDPETGDLYAATDFGVLRLAAGATAWTKEIEGLPTVAVYGLTVTADGNTLYAATHGRGLWSLELS